LTALDVAERLGLAEERVWRPQTPPLVPAGD